MLKNYSLSNIRYIASDKIESGSISIKGNFIENFNISKHDYKLENALVIPAFINAHDHLFGTYFPKIGHGPYERWLEWDNDLKKDDVYKERSKLDKETVYLLGAYRNFISGVLTVSDHIPHKVNDDIIDIMPIRVLKDYSLAHEAVSYDLNWGDGLDIEHQRALENNIPFITHIAEGYDEESLQSLNNLIEAKALSDNTVLVHGIALSDQDLENIAKAKANLVWCPNSNYFMFERTSNIKKWMENGINVSLGTDSPATGSQTFIDEMHFAQDYYKRLYNEYLPERTLYNMVTENPAKCLRLYTLGKIKDKNIADLLILKDKNKDPYKTISTLTLKDIDAIIQNGLFVYSNEKYSEMVYQSNENVYVFNVEGEKRYCAYDIKGLMGKIRNILGYIKEFPFLPID